MSAIDFVLEGSSGEHFAEWDFDRECEDEISFAPGQPSFIEQKNLTQRPLSQRISYNANEKFTFSLIDNLIQVKSFSTSYREEKVDFWKSKRLTVGLTALIGGFAFGGLAVAASSPLFTIVAATSALAFLILGSYRASEAHSQITCWQRNLPEAIAAQRSEAFATGLLAIYKQDEMGASLQPALFSKVLSPIELNGLYLEYFDAFQKELAAAENDKRKLELLEKASEYSPMTARLMNYAKVFPCYNIPLTLYCQELCKFIKAYREVESAVGDKILEVQKNAQDQINSVEQSKTIAISAIYTTYDIYVKSAENTRDEKLRSLPPGPNYDAYRSEIILECQTAIDQAKLIRDNSIRLISLPFDMQIATIRSERDEYIQRIKVNRDAHLLPLFTFIEALHKEAYSVATGLQPPRQYFDQTLLQPQFAPPPYMPPLPSAPPLDDLLEDDQQSYDPRVFDAFLDVYLRQGVAA